MNQEQLHNKAQGLVFALGWVNDLPVGKVISLLTVALKEGLTVDEYAKRAGISATTMSRHLLDLGPVDRNGAPGRGLVDGRTNITNQREKIYGLTPKGRELLAKVIGGLR